MKTLAFLTLLGAALLGPVGCTTTIGHRDGECEDFAAHGMEARLAVLRFTDKRPLAEIAPPREFLAWWDSTRDEAWDDEDVVAAISREVARHLRESGLYAQVDYVDLPSETFGTVVARSLRAQGYDAVLAGEVEHFHGMRRWDLARGGVLSVAGPAGTGANFLMGHRAGAETVLKPVRLARTLDGVVLWEGQGIGTIAETAYIVGDAGGYANQSLHAAITDLRQGLDENHGGISRALGVESSQRAAEPQPDKKDNILVGSIETGVDGVKKIGEGVGKVVDSGLDTLVGALGLK